MFSKLLHFTILPVESFYHRHTTNAENYISSLRIFPCSTMLHQRSIQGSNDSRENSRQKFPSIHPSIPFEFLVELVVSKDETPPLSFGPYASIPMERGNGGSPYREHRPGYHFLRKITIPCEDDGDDLSPRGCQKRLLLLRLMMRDVKRLSRFHPVSIATSMPSKTFNHVAAMKERERVGDGEKLVSDVNTGIDSFLRFERTKCLEETNRPFLLLLLFPPPFSSFDIIRVISLHERMFESFLWKLDYSPYTVL